MRVYAIFINTKKRWKAGNFNWSSSGVIRYVTTAASARVSWTLILVIAPTSVRSRSRRIWTQVQTPAFSRFAVEARKIQIQIKIEVESLAVFSRSTVDAFKHAGTARVEQWRERRATPETIFNQLIRRVAQWRVPVRSTRSQVTQCSHFWPSNIIIEAEVHGAYGSIIE